MFDASFSDFFKLGFEHIFSGYDHLFFLFGVLLGCRRWRELVLVVTSFTIGHSLTLALATLNVIALPARITEPTIAFTILWVGAENCWRRGEAPAHRWMVTLLFGLVHGIGFANVLRDLGVGSNGRGFAIPLLGFNLGVETGQLIFAAMLVLLLSPVRNNPVFIHRWVPGLSALIALAGLYWVIERILVV